MKPFTIGLMRAAAAAEVHVSGLLVGVQPGRLDEVAHRVPRVAGATVQAYDRNSARLVVTVEGDTVEALEAAGTLLAHLPGVLTVNLVCHFVDGRGAS